MVGKLAIGCTLTFDNDCEILIITFFLFIFILFFVSNQEYVVSVLYSNLFRKKNRLPHAILSEKCDV